MPVVEDAEIEITGFAWVPDFARGYVRDLRPRWACEEAGLPYRERLIAIDTAKGADFRREQPFGQVPVYADDTVRLFESGAMVLHIAERAGGLMPDDAAGRARVTAWVIAALNSVEPFVIDLTVIDLFSEGEEWAKLRRPAAVEIVQDRLKALSNWLGDRPYLERDFTAADIIMATVLREVPEEVLAPFANLVAYRDRCVARPAFERAHAAQLASFASDPIPA